MKYIKAYENQILNSILDKISQSGIESLSSLEKEYLDKFSKEQPTQEIQKNIYSKKYSDKIGPYDATLILYGIEEPYTKNHIFFPPTYDDGNTTRWFGELTVNDIKYNGQILCQDDYYLTSFFYNDDGDVFTDLEGLEYEIDQFCENAFYNAKNVNESLLLEGRIEDIEIKFEKKIDPKIVEYFKENDPTPNKAYFEWLCDRYSKLTTKKENIEKTMIKMVTKYENIKFNLEEKQINRIKSVDGLSKILNQNKNWDELKTYDEDGSAKILYDSIEWMIYVPYTFETSGKFGDKSWCTVYEPEEHFNKHFGEEGALTYCINKLDTDKNFAIEQTIVENGERKCIVWDNKDEKPLSDVFLIEVIKNLIKINYLEKDNEIKNVWKDIVNEMPYPEMTESMLKLSMADLLEQKGVIWVAKEFGTYIIFETIDVSDNYIYIENFINDKLKEKIIKNPADIDDETFLYKIIINDFPNECDSILDSVPWEEKQINRKKLQILEEIGIYKVFQYFSKDRLNELIDSYIQEYWETPQLENKIEQIWSIDANDSLDIPELANVINDNISWTKLTRSIFYELDMEQIRDVLEI